MPISPSIGPQILYPGYFDGETIWSSRYVHFNPRKRTLADFEVALNGRAHADDLEVITALILQDEGIAWLPDFLAGDAAKAGKLVPVLPQWRPKKHKLWKYYIVYAGRRYALPKVEAFVQTALEQV